MSRRPVLSDDGHETRGSPSPSSPRIPHPPGSQWRPWRHRSVKCRQKTASFVTREHYLAIKSNFFIYFTEFACIGGRYWHTRHCWDGGEISSGTLGSLISAVPFPPTPNKKANGHETRVLPILGTAVHVSAFRASWRPIRAGHRGRCHPPTPVNTIGIAPLPIMPAEGTRFFRPHRAPTETIDRQNKSHISIPSTPNHP